MIDTLPWLVLLPLVWACAAFMLGRRHAAWLATAALALQLVLTVVLAMQVLAAGPQAHMVGGWTAPLGIGLIADGLAAAMLLLTHAVALPVAIYARAYFDAHPAGARHFWPITGFLIAGMNALYLSADIFNLYVALELVGLGAVGLVAAKADAGQVVAALRYLFATLVGSGAYLIGVALMYASFGNVSIAHLSAQVAAAVPVEVPVAVMLAAALMMAGLLIKTALLPFHFWLPAAHGGAPAPVSALLSALVIKATFYLIARLWLGLFEPIMPPLAGQMLGWLGALAVLWGGTMALRQTRLKMLVAYSTVAQIGYLFLLFPLATGTTAAVAARALDGVMLQVLAHGLAKAAMFAAAGAVVLSIGRDDISQLGGISSRLPLTLFTFGIAGVTLIGLPPSAGFLAKWVLLDAAIAAGQWQWVALLVLGGLLTAAYVFKVLRNAFLQTEQSTTYIRLPAAVQWPPLLLAVASLLLGMRAVELLALLEAV